MPGSGPEHGPCRCLTAPCNCRSCLIFLLKDAQQAHESAGGWIDGPMYDYIPKLLHGGKGPIPRGGAKAVRIYLETISQTSYPLLYTG